MGSIGSRNDDERDSMRKASYGDIGEAVLMMHVCAGVRPRLKHIIKDRKRNKHGFL